MSIELSIIDEYEESNSHKNTSLFDNDTFKYIFNTKNLNTIFKVLFGNSLILLTIVLLSEIIGYDLNIGLPIGNWKFQFANFFFLISNITSNIFLLRIFLTCGGLWFIIWMYTYDAGIIVDGIMWNYISVLINIRHAFILFYAKRPIIFDKDREQLYINTFCGIMSRANFKILCKNSFIRELGKDRYYAQKGDTCNNLAILISGKISIIKQEKEDSIMSSNNKNIVYNQSEEQYITPNEFIDSPEFIMRKTKNKFTVDMYVDKKCKFLIWPCEILNEILSKNPQIEPALMGVLGIDVSKKIFRT